MTWLTTRMGKYCRVKHGYAFKGECFDSEGPYVLLTPGSFNEEGGYRDQGEKTKFYTGDIPEGYVLDEGDLLVAMTEQTPGLLGSSAWIPESGRLLHNQRLGRIVALDEGRLNKRFLYYLFNTKDVRDQISATATGGKVRHTAPERIAQVVFHRPPLDTQRSIAAVLSAYDDLIENNRRRMALLEEAARQLYREWFVRLRFPGHEHTRITKGVPEGWERKPISELCESIDYGYTASAEQDEIGPKFLRITDIVPDVIDWTSVPYCPIEEERLAKFRLVEGDIVIARTGATVGYAKRLNKRHPEAVFASYLVRIRLKPEIDNLMVGVFVESGDYKSYVQSRVGGAAQPNANAKVLSAVEILVPPPIIQRIFNGSVEPLVDQREVMQLQNKQLRAARDLLLPRLMSGEIAV